MQQQPKRAQHDVAIILLSFGIATALVGLGIVEARGPPGRFGANRQLALGNGSFPFEPKDALLGDGFWLRHQRCGRGARVLWTP
jgi:hypothetical protein